MIGHYSNMGGAAGEPCFLRTNWRQKTKETYASYNINNWTEHIIAHHPEYWSAETGQLILPLPIEVMKSFCNANCHQENGKLKSQSTVNGYKSALKTEELVQGRNEANSMDASNRK